MLRLIFCVFFLLLSLLTVFKAPAYHLWLAAILVTEYPLFMILGTAISLAVGIWRPRYQLPGTLAGVTAILLFLKPIAQAYLLSMELKQSSMLANPTGGQPAFRFSTMLTIGNSRGVNPRNHTYISYQNLNLTLDYYSSRLPGLRPCIIIIHGGSWKSGDNKQLPELNSSLANAGYHVAAINYRLAPRYKNPSAVQDVAAAISFLKKHSAELRIDSSNLVLLGRSAGAQIALLAAYTLHEPGIRGVIDFYGPADMVWGYSVPANPLVMNSRKVMEDYLGGTYKEMPQQYLSSSPIHFVSPASVPTLIIHGENDPLVAYGHSTRLRNELNENGVKHYFLSLPWATHGFDYNINGPGGQLSTFAVKRFIDRVTQK